MLDLRGVQPIRVGMGLHLERVVANTRADMSRHDDGHLDVWRVDPEIGNQRLGEALHRELRRGIGGMRHVGSDRGPETVHAAGVDDVCLIRGAQHRQEGPRVQIDATPTDVEGAFPFRALADDHTPAATDTSVVEQQVNAIGSVLGRNLVTETKHVGFIGDVGDVRRDAQTLWQAGRLAQTLGFRHAAGGHIAHRDGAALGHQLTHEFAAHPRAAAGHHGDPAGEVFHWFSSLAVAPPSIRSGGSIRVLYR